MTETPKPSALDDVLRRCEEGLAASWPALTSDRRRIVAEARAELAALRLERDDLEVIARALRPTSMRRLIKGYGQPPRWGFYTQETGEWVALADTGTGLPVLTDAARAALKEKA